MEKRQQPRQRGEKMEMSMGMEMARESYPPPMPRVNSRSFREYVENIPVVTRPRVGR